MPSKTQEYLKLANRTANGITRYWEHWTDFLTTASRLYKYSFTDQLMIYAQRPDATACASFDIWNNRMNRYVRRGSKGIALLDQSSSVPRLHYVFDVSDTGVRRNSRDPEVWQLKGQQDTYRRLCGNSYNREYLGYLCVDEIGNIIRPNYVSEQFPKLLEKNGLRPIRFHDLRHSCASLMVMNGVSMKQVQEWLGHSTFSTTADIYAHLDYKSKQGSAGVIANLLGESKLPK